MTKAKITVLFVCYFFSLKNVLKRCPNTFKRYPYNFYSKILRFAASNATHEMNMVGGHFDFVNFFDLRSALLDVCMSDVYCAESMCIWMLLKGQYFILHHIDHDSGGDDLHFRFAL